MQKRKINSELIARYAITKAEEELKLKKSKNLLSEKEIELVEAELASNPELLDLKNEVQSNYLETYADLDGKGLDSIVLEPRLSQTKDNLSLTERIRKIIFMPTIKAPAIAIASIALVFILFTQMTKALTPNYFPLIAHSFDVELPVLRNEQDRLSLGKVKFNQRNYDDAITVFRNQLNLTSGEENTTLNFYASYYLGLTYLLKSERPILGLLPNYELADLDSAAKYLQLHTHLDSATHLSGDIDWYLGVANLLRYSINEDLVSKELAVEYFKKVSAADTQHTLSAKKILVEFKE